MDNLSKESGLLMSPAVNPHHRRGCQCILETHFPLSQDRPHKFDTDEWLAAGAGYAIFTATHFNGFMQWQSDLYPYGLT